MFTVRYELYLHIRRTVSSLKVLKCILFTPYPSVTKSRTVTLCRRVVVIIETLLGSGRVAVGVHSGCKRTQFSAVRLRKRNATRSWLL